MSGSLREEFIANGRLADCPIYDLHGHWGNHYQIHLPASETSTARKLLTRANVRRLVICHHAALLSPDIGNRANIEAVQSMPDILRAYCAINPNYPDEIKKDVDSFEQQCPDIYVGFKLLSDYHRIPLSDTRYRPAFETADRLKKLVLLHTWGGSTFNGYEEIRAAAEKYPHAHILMGHSLHGEWDNAIRLANEHPNLYLELTAVPDECGVVERFVKEVGSAKIIFGTDFPWFSHFYYIGALLGAGLDGEDLRNILYRNAQRLLNIPTT